MGSANFNRLKPTDYEPDTVTKTHQFGGTIFVFFRKKIVFARRHIVASPVGREEFRRHKT
jgi:hypothetical protein